MLTRLAQLVVRRPKWVVAASILLVVVAGAAGSGLADRMTSGGFEDPDAEAPVTADILEEKYGAEAVNFVLLVTAKSGTVDDPAVAAAGQALTEELAAEEGLLDVASYWSLGRVPPLRSIDGRQAIVLAHVIGDDDEVDDRVSELTPAYTRDTEVVTVGVTGFAAVFNEVSETIESDLVKAETVAIPITLLLLVLVFGSVVAATLPLMIGVIAVFGSFAILNFIAGMTDVSIFALNMVTAMGFGLAIDYSLFIVSRFREEMGAGKPTDTAVIRTVETAGRTILFSGLTVAVSLAALLVFPLAFLRSFAYAGIAVVTVAVVGAIATLPAVMTLLGPRVDKLTLWKRSTRPSAEGFWHTVALAVMRRPVALGAAVVALLVVLGLPFLGVQFGLPDDRVLPNDAESRIVSQQLRDNFPSNEAFRLSVLVDGIGDPAGRLDQVELYAMSLSQLDGVGRVDAATGSYVRGSRLVGPLPGVHDQFRGADGTWMAVVPEIEPYSPEGEQLVRDIRRADSPFGEVAVTGASAFLLDNKASLFSRVPLAMVLIALSTFVLLFLMFGSVVVPAKALVLNFLSLTATFGAMVWIFQEGHLSGLLDFEATGLLDTTTPILMFCIAFGLSMDYEVFLLSRIKEEYDRSGDNVQSVAVGLEKTGRIVTAAALLLSIVFLANVLSSITFIKLFGLGMTLAILVDATLVRGVLVPSFMRLAGQANWWAPGPLRRLHDRSGLRRVFSERDYEVVEAGTEPGADGEAGTGADGEGEVDVEEEVVVASASNGKRRRKSTLSTPSASTKTR